MQSIFSQNVVNFRTIQEHGISAKNALTNWGTSMSNSSTYKIPVWFVSFATFILILIIPWAAWVTVQNIEMGVKQGFILDRLEKIEAKDT